MTRPKTASELEALIRRQTGIEEDELEILVEPQQGATPNWRCTVRYVDRNHGEGPGAGFLREVATLQRTYHLQD